MKIYASCNTLIISGNATIRDGYYIGFYVNGSNYMYPTQNNIPKGCNNPSASLVVTSKNAYYYYDNTYDTNNFFDEYGLLITNTKTSVPVSYGGVISAIPTLFFSSCGGCEYQTGIYSQYPQQCTITTSKLYKIAC